MDTKAFNDAWLADLGAAVPERHGPQPAPPGPRPSAWGAPGELPGATTPPDQAPGSTGVPGSGGAGGSAGGDSVLPLAIIAIVVFGAAGLLAWSRSRRRPAGRDAVTVAARLRSIPSWQVTLGVALLGLGFLVAAQLAAEGPRVRYTTQERSPLVETATDLQADQDELKATLLDLRARIQTAEQAGEGSATLGKDLNDQLETARIAAGLIPLVGTGIVLQLEDSLEPSKPEGNAGDLLVGARDLRTIVEEMWEAGAEAIAVNGERMTPTTAVIDIGPSILVNSAYVSPGRTRSRRSGRTTCTPA